MKNKIIYLLAFTFLFTFSCKKYKLNRETTTSTDNSTAENLFDDVYKVVQETAQEDNSRGSISWTFGNCGTVTVDPAWPDTTFPKNVTVDFGSTNCTGNDGKQRRGKIEYTISDRYRNPACVINASPDNYYVNDYKVEGSKTVTNNGRNSSNNLSYTIEVTGAKITTPDNKEITWESTRTREWIEGEETNYFTPDTVNGGWLGVSGITDDVYSITGSAEGINQNGRDYTVTIEQALIVQVGCRWIKEGVLKIEPNELKTRTVDYGDGTCDSEATVEINNKTYTFYMY